MINLWRELAPGPNIPEIVYVVVEIPKGSRNKFEYGKELGIIKLDRVLFSSLHYPGDYGFIPRTLYDDGDALDVLVMVNEPTFPGCVIEARPIGLFKMLDNDVPDYKILAVPSHDPIFDDYQDLTDVPKHFLKEVSHFFEVYKDLEGKRAKPLGWEDAATAKKEVERSIEMYYSSDYFKGRKV